MLYRNLPACLVCINASSTCAQVHCLLRQPMPCTSHSTLKQPHVCCHQKRSLISFWFCNCAHDPPIMSKFIQAAFTICVNFIYNDKPVPRSRVASTRVYAMCAVSPIKNTGAAGMHQPAHVHEPWKRHHVICPRALPVYV